MYSPHRCGRHEEMVIGDVDCHRCRIGVNTYKSYILSRSYEVVRVLRRRSPCFLVPSINSDKNKTLKKKTHTHTSDRSSVPFWPETVPILFCETVPIFWVRVVDMSRQIGLFAILYNLDHVAGRGTGKPVWSTSTCFLVGSALLSKSCTKGRKRRRRSTVERDSSAEHEAVVNVFFQLVRLGFVYIFERHQPLFRTHAGFPAPRCGRRNKQNSS